MKNSVFDFAVIGAGGTGLAAAMYSARLGMKTIIFGASHGLETPIGGVITTTDIVENYPGFEKISGIELAREIEKHAKSYDLVNLKNETVKEIKKYKNIFSIKTNKGNYESKTILFATGTKLRKLDLEEAKKYENKGVHYCALCDGPLYRGKVVAIVGGSDSAAKEALFLANHAKKVYIIARGDKLRAEPVNMKRIEANKKIEVILEKNVTHINGDTFVTNLDLDKTYKGSKNLKVDGVFVAIGHIPMSELAKSLGVKVDEHDEIIIDHENSKTNLNGVFAAGDVTNKSFKQLITGVADGCTAAYYAHEYISKQ